MRRTLDCGIFEPVTCELFCPHCDRVIEILGEPPRGEVECECGGVFERFDPADRFELTAEGLAALEAALAQGAPAADSFESPPAPRLRLKLGG